MRDMKATRTERIRKAQGERLKAVRVEAGFPSARAAALSNNWSEQTYRAHEGGWRTIGLDDAERYARRFRHFGIDVTARGILFGDDNGESVFENESDTVRVLGVISAGGLIETSSEQVDHNDLVRVTIPFQVPIDTIGFRVVGMSMHPRYDPNDIVLCSSHGQPASSLVGLYSAVTADDGNRYLKRILKGSRKGLFHLESCNAMLMPDIKIIWSSEIIVTIHEPHWRRISPNTMEE